MHFLRIPHLVLTQPQLHQARCQRSDHLNDFSRTLNAVELCQVALTTDRAEQVIQALVKTANKLLDNRANKLLITIIINIDKR